MNPLLNRILAARAWLTRAAATPQGKLVLNVLRLSVLGGVMAFLVWQVSEVGWARVWGGLPRTPWFYALVVVLFLLLPVTEVFLFGRLWGVPSRSLVGASLRKRTLNAEVAGYSGDVYFCLWAQQQFGLSRGLVWRVYKDNTIVSAGASFLAAALLLAGLWFTDQMAFTELVRGQDGLYAAIGIGAVLLLTAAVVAFRRSILSLPSRTVAALLGIHLARFFTAWALQIVMWWVVVPSAPLETWGTMLAVMTVIGRLPLPARDLMGIGAVLGMSGLLQADEAAIAGMLLARSALDRLLNAAVFGLSLLWERRHPRPPTTAAPSDAEREALA